MRTLAILSALALAVLAFGPTAAAHWDRSSTDPCPPNDIRWWFDHFHRDCCTPSWACIDVTTAPERAPLLP